MATGAIISGRRTFELAGRWNGDHHDGVPILVLTHHVDDGDIPPASARFYTDVVECAAAAREGARGKDVMVHGAGAGQALIRAGELDEIEVHLVSVVLGGGRRLFDLLDDLPAPVELGWCGRSRGATPPTCAIASSATPDPSARGVHMRRRAAQVSVRGGGRSTR